MIVSQIIPFSQTEHSSCALVHSTDSFVRNSGSTYFGFIARCLLTGLFFKKLLKFSINLRTEGLIDYDGTSRDPSVGEQMSNHRREGALTQHVHSPQLIFAPMEW